MVAIVEEIKEDFAASCVPRASSGCAIGSAIDSEVGASLVEYALLVALVSLVAIVSIREMGVQVDGTFGEASLAMQPQVTRPGGTTRGPARR